MISIRRMLACGLLLASFSVLKAQGAPARPKIVGLSHFAIYAHDFEASRRFYGEFLGLEEVFPLKNPDGSTFMTFFKINDHEYVELFPEKAAGTDRLSHISFETDDIEGLRHYLAAKGVKVPATLTPGKIGNLAFNITDPAGHTVEMVQYLPTGETAKNFGQHLGPNRISTQMSHVGIIVTDLQAESDFYTKVLGFTETWRGSANGSTLSWVNLKVPNGTDYVEFMLKDPVPPPTKRGSEHHMCLVVPSVHQAVEKLKASPFFAAYGKPIEEKQGINRKRQANLFDPDGTRVELMEPTTIDGTPTPPSTAPWPAAK